MSEVKYSVNGKYFKDFQVYVSASDGLFDALPRKFVNIYEWAEYHGSAPDLTSPKFEVRKISLQCFVVGSDWLQMKENFDQIVREFQKPGTQRLLIEPYGLKPLPFEVFMVEGVVLEKTLNKSKMIGVFTLRLIEPNPIKKVLLLTGTTLNLAYDSPMETEIFYGNGEMDSVYNDAVISGKVLPPGDKYIIIAGDIDRVTNLVTNANVVWDRL